MIRFILRLLGLWPKKEEEKNLESICQTFENDILSRANHYISHRECLSMKCYWEKAYKYVLTFPLPKRHELNLNLSHFLSTYQQLDTVIENLNDSFIDQEIQRCDALLSNIDGKSLDIQQRKVVVTDEDRSLVIAGAGSGKTLTIVGKVKYLCEEKHIDPKDILLIAFTNKAADQMTEKLKHMGIPITARTFHKIGISTIAAKTKAKPTVYNEEQLSKFIKSYFNEKLLQSPFIAQCLLTYFAYYTHIPTNNKQFESFGAIYDHEKGQDFETIRGKYRKELLIREGINKCDPLIALTGEKLKSRQEVIIANFLFLHGVDYEYEATYPYVSPDRHYGTYHPDFYLSEYGIYIEHFGIDKNGRTPQYSPIEEAKYLDGIAWKRSIHKEFGTPLVETYSYYDEEGCLLEELERKLIDAGVSFKEPDLVDIFNTVYPSISEKYIPNFIKLCSTFIRLLKSNGYQIRNILDTVKKNPKKMSPFSLQRTILFTHIINPILTSYNQYLAEQQHVDFADMINHATQIVNDETYHPHPYKWIIVDEYQDISVARYKLIKALLDRTGAKLLCVGDDWQSIYRFAGSDISLFTQFESYFGSSKIMKIEKTYRNSQELIDVAGAFVMRNPAQITKYLYSDKHLSYPITFMCYSFKPLPILIQTLRKIISDSSENSTIMLLGRTKADMRFIEEAYELFTVKKSGDQIHIVFHEKPDQKIFFLTVHKAKGLEADNVVILNFRNDILGFPSKMVDDPLLDLVLTQGDDFSYAEERRLFYVAITRTRNRTFVLTDIGSPSEFYLEFADLQSTYVYTPVPLQTKSPKCPRCKTGILVPRKSSSGIEFVGCSHFPRCGYTDNNTSILDNPQTCPNCGGFLIEKASPFGIFYGCTNFPHCKYKLITPIKQ